MNAQHLAELAAARQQFLDDKNAHNFLEYLKKFVLGPHTYEQEDFLTIHQTLANFETLSNRDEADIKDILYFLLDLVEESPDSQSYTPGISTPPPDMLEHMEVIAKKYFGVKHVILYKILLLKVWFSTAPLKEAQEIFESYDDISAAEIRQMFHKGTPKPTTGTDIDENEKKDAVRDIRFIFALGILLRAQGNLIDARKIFVIGNSWTVTSVSDRQFLNQRGIFALSDLTYATNRLLREMAALSLEMGNYVEAHSYIHRSAGLELVQRGFTRIPMQYIRLLRFIDNNHSFSLAELKTFLERNQEIQARYLGLLEALLRVTAGLQAKEGNTEESVHLLQVGIDYILNRLQQLPAQEQSEFAFEEFVTESYHNLIHDRMRYNIANAGSDEHMRLEAYQEYVNTVREQQMEDTGGQPYIRALESMMLDMRQMVDSHTISPDLKAHLEAVVEDLLREFTSYDLDSQPDFQVVASSLYHIRADMALRFGSVQDFITNWFHAHYIGLASKKEELSTSSETEISYIIARLCSILKDNGHETVSQRLEYESKALLPVTDVAQEKPKEGLKKAALEAFLKNFMANVNVIAKLLQSTEGQSALKILHEELDQDGTIDFGKSGTSKETSEKSCPGKGKRSLGFCIDMEADDDNEELIDDEMFDKFMSNGDHWEFSRLLSNINMLAKQKSGSNTVTKDLRAEIVKDAKSVSLDSIEHLDSSLKNAFLSVKLSGTTTELETSMQKSKTLAAKIQSAAETAGLAFTVFLVGKHLANANLKGLGYDALNLYIMPKVGQNVASQVAKLGEVTNSGALKAVSPVLGRSIGNFAAFLGLYESIKLREDATDPVDKTIADVNIVTNSVFIAADIPALATEVVTATTGVELGLLSEFAGPIGVGVSVTAIIASQFIQAELQLEKVEEMIDLTTSEKSSVYWRIFFGRDLQDYINRDIQAERIYGNYLGQVIKKIGDSYSKLIVSKPTVEKLYYKVRYGAKSSLFKVYCQDRMILMNSTILPGKKNNINRHSSEFYWPFSFRK